MVLITSKGSGSEQPSNNDINPTSAAGVVSSGWWRQRGLPEAVWYAAAAGYVERCTVICITR